MLPINFLIHTSKYSLNLNGFNIQARVVEEFCTELLDSGIAELRSKLDSHFPIVGFDLKYFNPSNSSSKRDLKYLLLVLYTKDYCLLLKLTKNCIYSSYFHNSSLFRFLNDKSICLLGWEVFEKVILLGFIGSRMETCVNVCSFATRVLKKRELEKCCDLMELASKVGAAETLPADEASHFMKTDIEIPFFEYLNDVCFSVKEVKFAVVDAYLCYTIGTKLMSKP